MKNAAIYCRVSTDNQEQEGTSLQTQLEARLSYCHDKGYDMAYRFSEAYLGLTPERPKLNELRELVKVDEIDVIVVYCLDRLSRDPTHGVIFTQEMEKQRQDANELGVLEAELEQVERQLKALDRDQAQLLQWALKGFPEGQAIAENKKLNAGRERLKAQRAELETQIKASQEARISLPKVEHFVELIHQKLTTLDCETKRQVLDMLGIKVWPDGDNVEITGVLPTEEDAIVTTQSCLSR